MAEYIEREALIKELLSNAFTDDLYGMGLTRGIEISVATAKRINAADVAPVRHGRWIAPFLSNSGNICAECSHCHKIRIIDDYCSACGTIMDLEDTED